MAIVFLDFGAIIIYTVKKTIAALKYTLDKGLNENIKNPMTTWINTRKIYLLSIFN